MKEMKKYIATIMMSLCGLMSFAQSVYMHEAQQDAEESGATGIKGILCLVVSFGIIYFINYLSNSKKDRIERQEKAKKVAQEKEREAIRAKNRAIQQEKLEKQYENYNGVDLGLSVVWSEYNMGLFWGLDLGTFYGWGCLNSDRFGKQITIVEKGISDIAGDPDYDIAANKIGNGWRLPTPKEMEELIYKCKWEKVTKKEGEKIYNGMRVIGPNGNSIYLPCGKHSDKNQKFDNFDEGYYWTSEAYNDRPYEKYTDKIFAKCLHFYFNGITSSSDGKPYIGMSQGSEFLKCLIRPVRSK